MEAPRLLRFLAPTATQTITMWQLQETACSLNITPIMEETHKATISSKTGTILLYVGLVQGKCMMKNGRSLDTSYYCKALLKIVTQRLFSFTVTRRVYL